MTNQEIDHKLAKAMGYRIGKSSLDGVIMVYKDKTNKVPRYFRPTTNMQDTWEVAERFGFVSLETNSFGRFDAWIGDRKKLNTEHGNAETATLAICKAALRVIENRERSKSDE